jgi:hypothetical protein|nr:MAG TPA: hypothetical protein [Caudoviricetes sp.]
MSTQDLTPAPSNEGENAPSNSKPSLRARIKARRQEYAEKHPLRAACAAEAVKGATYAVAATGTLIALGALGALGSKNSDDETDDIIESDAEDILDDEEE